MRVQDWLADRFSFVQYAVPRVKPASKARVDWQLMRSHGRDIAVGAGATLVVIHELAKALTPRKSEPPVAILFVLSAIAAVPGLMIVMLL